MNRASGKGKKPSGKKASIKDLAVRKGKDVKGGAEPVGSRKRPY